MALAAAPAAPGPLPWWLGGLAAACALLAMSRRRRRFVIVALLAGVVLGLWRGGGEQAAFSRYQAYFGKTVNVAGTVAEDTSHGDGGSTRAQLKHVSVNGQPMHGKVWVSFTASQQTGVKRSDHVRLQGSLKDGFGSFPASLPEARLIRLTPASRHDTALQARDRFADGIRSAIPEPAASLGSGFVTGQHSDLPGDLADELKVVGLTHAVVASGSNLTILVACARRLFAKASKFVATVGGGAIAFGFILVAGFSPSMTRAGLVTGLVLAAWYYGRAIHPLVLLPLAAAITVVANPSYLWGDIGWYLSFAAFAGVLILAPLLHNYFWGTDQPPKLLREIFIGTLAAQLVTTPIILFAFGTYSSYALLANMLVLPLIPLAMLLTFVGGLAGVALPAAVAAVIGWPAAAVMEYMLQVIHWVAGLPSAQGTAAFGSVALLASYGVLLVSITYLWRRTGHRFGSETNILIGDHR